MKTEQAGRLRLVEIILLLFLAAFLASGAMALQTGQELSDKVVRLHVLANSDSEEDQALKLKVRDRILAYAEPLLAGAADRREAEALLRGRVLELERIAAEEIQANGYDYSVAIELEDTVFPTREYEGFALPAGNYTALRVTIGEGKGQNWWCVAFPPLCLGAASETVDQALEAGHFTSDQGALVTGDGESYVLKFKAMELLGEIQGFFKG